MKIVLNFDPITNQISDKNGMYLFLWNDLQYEELPSPQGGQASPTLDGEQLIRMMKIVAHVDDPSEVKGI